MHHLRVWLSVIKDLLEGEEKKEKNAMRIGLLLLDIPMQTM